MINLQQLIDDVKCYEVVRELRWPDGVRCPECGSGKVINVVIIHIKLIANGINVKRVANNSTI